MCLVFHLCTGLPQTRAAKDSLAFAHTGAGPPGYSSSNIVRDKNKSTSKISNGHLHLKYRGIISKMSGLSAAANNLQGDSDPARCRETTSNFDMRPGSFSGNSNSEGIKNIKFLCLLH